MTGPSPFRTSAPCHLPSALGMLLAALLVACAPQDRQANEAAAPAAAPATPPPAWVEVPLAENAFREHASGYREDTLSVTIDPGPGLEVNLGMKSGAAVVYSWNVMSPTGAAITSEFHGHTERQPGQSGTLMFYRKAAGSSESGSLVAPFDGVHAWYFRNDTTAPIVIRMTISGFYELLSKDAAIVRVSP